MSDETDEILAKIDAAVGPPADETDEQHEARKLMVERDHRAREIRRDAQSNRGA